ncbi:hypothetical protein Nepgr_019393 [Nepenthes gracilis]|uniref:Glycosyltransferase n=1 Tax=Nepenthes gracilis TaxID=150966 RepID=A0AAD3SVU9_NEPGR|nr:hypothetical protein Nepgr_019393 [Nepenthes gracilis]
MASERPRHAVIFPFMAEGHTIPLLDLSNALSLRGLKVTVVTTPSNAPQIASAISKSSNISVHIIPFPQADGLPHGCENTNHISSMDQLLPFFKATLQLRHPFESFLRGVAGDGCRPICVITDLLLGWSLPVCRSFDIPGILFHGMGVLSSAISRVAFLNAQLVKSSSDTETLNLPALTSVPFTLARADFPVLVSDDNPVLELLAEIGDADSSCYGVVVNSFAELEGDYVSVLESSYREGTRAWCVGPAFLYGRIGEERNDELPYYLSWLDERKGSGNVIYVCFGTQAHLSDLQMEEIALGLEMAGWPFLWVVKSRSWTPPEGWEERVKGRGLVVRGWVEQRRILAHAAVGGFLSHGGWNSVLESLTAGVPLLVWPMGAEQPLNAKFVVEVLAAGIGIQRRQDDAGVVERSAICGGVKDLMGGEKGIMATQKAEEVARAARRAVEGGGSSSDRLDQLIKCLTDIRKDMQMC